MLGKRKLKNYFIYPEFQWKLIFLFMGVSLVAPLLILAFQLVLFNQEFLINLPKAHPHMVFHSLFQQQLIIVFMMATGVGFIVAFVLGILISHRVAGPLVKLRKHFENTAQDQLHDTSVQFRENDFFRDVAAAYNLRFETKK